MNPIKRTILITLALFLISACAAWMPGATDSPLPTAQSIIPTPEQTPVYTGLLTAPDGTARAEVICHPEYGMLNCKNYFPNGNTLNGIPRDWSPDGRYAVVSFGETHDSSPVGYQVWDTVNGTNNKWFLVSPYQWAPDQEHTLIYLEGSNVGEVPTDLIEFDPATNHETVLQECPAWFEWAKEHGCPASSGVVVGGKVTGLPQKAQAVISTHALNDEGKLRGYQTVEEDGSSWMQLLRESYGQTFHIDIWWYGYVGIPPSYDLYIEEGQVYLLKDGQRELIRPDSLDFVLEKDIDGTATAFRKQPEPHTPIIKGELSGLPGDTLVVIRTFNASKQQVQWGTRRGDGVWESVIPYERGAEYVITAIAEGFVTTPVSYTVRQDAEKAYLVENGSNTPTEALHLDFHFTPAATPNP
ncbi:MAG: hypothetical protein JXA21_24835 [Anaerolineae bacterium]|nr:hypothetical protein [Anaerolineae bacterium]